MDTIDTAANLAAVERAVAGVRWYRDDSPLEYIKAKGGKITMYDVEPVMDADVTQYRCRMAVAWPHRPDAVEDYGDTEQHSVQIALITLALRWSDLTPRENGGQVTIFGKGSKTRQVLIPSKLWEDLQLVRGEDDAPVFTSPRSDGKPLCRKSGWYIVKQAVKRAGINWKASCQWLRHAHATHALKRHADIKLVSTTLGHSNVSVTNVYLDVQPGESSSLNLMEV